MYLAQEGIPGRQPEPRICCIRCGGADFHVLECRKPNVAALERLPVRHFTAVENCFPLAAIAITGIVSDTITIGSYI